MSKVKLWAARRYARLYKAGKCTRCGREFDRGDNVICGRCRSTFRKYQKTEYARKKRAGLCCWSGCDRRNDGKHIYCHSHVLLRRVGRKNRKK